MRVKDILSGRQRADFGCITTWEAATGQRLTLHRAGRTRDVLARMCDYVVTIDPTYRLICYSTPQTIYGDMDGARADFVGQFGYGQPAAKPEETVLGAIGRRDMLHMRLSRMTDGQGKTRVRR